MALSDFWGVFVLLALLVAGVVLLSMLFVRVGRSRVSNLALQRKSRILTAAERNFFECLASSLSEDYYIFTKVRMLDAVEPSPQSTWWHAKQSSLFLGNQCLDYVLCKKNDMSIFGVIELENFDKGVKARDRARREKLVSDVCKMANLRLFYFDIRQDYKSIDIRRLVTGRSSRQDDRSSPTHQSQLSIDGATESEFSSVRSCPKCHSEVVTKVAVKGKRIGEKFIMCRKYPYCDYQVSVNDAKLLKMQRKEEQKVKKPGFSDWSAG